MIVDSFLGDFLFMCYAMDKNSKLSFRVPAPSSDEDKG